MTLTINIDEETRNRLEREAIIFGKPLEEYLLYVAKRLEEYISEPGKVPSSVDKTTKKPNLGFASGRGIWIADDFDEPLEEFKDYM